jgi:ABC-type transport system involved in Fe-S cluster assembly fused permease/ATPase subunit
MIYLICLFLSHYIFDYGYSITPKMIKAKSIGSPILPIMKHAGLHTIGISLVITLFTYNSDIYFLNLILGSFAMFCTHTFIDVMKGRIGSKYKRLSNPSDPLHWHFFALDQFLHTLVIILIYFTTTNPSF